MSAVPVNQELRLARGEHGEVVVTAAYCGRCQREVMPRDDGSCLWCGTMIVDEDALPAKRLLELLESGETTYTAGSGDVPVEGSGLEPQAGEADGVPSPDPVPPVSPTPGGAGESASSPAASPTRRRRRRIEYDRNEIRAQLLAFHEAHGREPAFADIKSHPDVLPPSLAAVEWKEVALELGWADPTAPKRAPRPRRSSLEREPSAGRRDGAESAAAAASVTGQGEHGHGQALPSRSEIPSLGDLTVDDLWLLYDALVGSVVFGAEEVRGKLRALLRAGGGA